MEGITREREAPQGETPIEARPIDVHSLSVQAAKLLQSLRLKATPCWTVDQFLLQLARVREAWRARRQTRSVAEETVAATRSRT